MFISPAFAQSVAEAASSGNSFVSMIVELLLIFAIFYILLIRPQQKRVKEHEAKLAAIKRGDKIVTGGGIYAKVVSVSATEDELEVEVTSNVVIKIARSTVREVLTGEHTAANNNKKK